MRILPIKWRLLSKVLPLVVMTVLAKLLIHELGWEFLTLNPLFTAIISANTFLIGFLISGVLADYKESEKLPGEIAVSLEAIAEECRNIWKSKGAEESKECVEAVSKLAEATPGWFHRNVRTQDMLAMIAALADGFVRIEPYTQANYIVRLKQEQSSLRRLITRVDAVRDTSFISSGYAISEIITAVLVFGLIFLKYDPYSESVFFVAFVSLIMIYMIYLIKDLDNPFHYSKKDPTEEVSLKPIVHAAERIKAMVR